MDRDAVVIEVGLNEAAMRARQPNVAYAPSECAQDVAGSDDVRRRLGVE